MKPKLNLRQLLKQVQIEALGDTVINNINQDFNIRLDKILLNNRSLYVINWNKLYFVYKLKDMTTVANIQNKIQGHCLNYYEIYFKTPNLEESGLLLLYEPGYYKTLIPYNKCTLGVY